jgi:hypothetical protein
VTSKREIKKFLRQFKKYAQNKFIFIERQGNLLTMTYLGLTFDDTKGIVLNLTPDNYCEGPYEDTGNPGYKVWMFGILYRNQELYIKLSDDYTADIAKCLSFHIAKHKLNYPLKKTEEK